jgi:transcriptional regulator with XRE-family HTH domain
LNNVKAGLAIIQDKRIICSRRMAMTSAVGTHIRQARLRYGMSQAELARRIGISKTAMNDLEQGKTRDPHLSYIVAIADELRLSIDALIGRKDHGDAAVTTTAPRPRTRKAAPVG